MTFMQAMLQISLAVLDRTHGFTVHPDQYDLDECEDGATAVITAHLGDDVVVACFTPDDGLDRYRRVLDAPSRVYRILDDDEVRRRLDASENAAR